MNIIVGVIVAIVVLLLVGIVVCVCRNKKKKQTVKPDMMQVNNTESNLDIELKETHQEVVETKMGPPESAAATKQTFYGKEGETTMQNMEGTIYS